MCNDDGPAACQSCCVPQIGFDTPTKGFDVGFIAWRSLLNVATAEIYPPTRDTISALNPDALHGGSHLTLDERPSPAWWLAIETRSPIQSQM